MSATSDKNKAAILAHLWVYYRYDEDFAKYFEFADLGLPLAYSIDNKMVKPTKEAWKFVNEAWDLLLVSLQVHDTGFETIEEIFDAQIDGQDEE